MNILFMQEIIHPERGGIGRVTCHLAKYFTAQGHKVWYYTATDSGYRLEDHFVSASGNFEDSTANRAELLSIIRNCGIDVVINQNGLGRTGSELAYHCRETNAELVSVVHNTLLGGIRRARYAKAGWLRRFGMSWLAPVLEWRLVNRGLVFAYKRKIRAHYRRLCKVSTRVVLLSKSIMGELAEVIGSCPDNVLALPNPCPDTGPVRPECVKKKRILWVGRVVECKRLDLWLDIWRTVAPDFPGWYTTVIGDGPCLHTAQAWVRANRVAGVDFVGSVDALPYYQDAAILAFTSAYEGFPMVFGEAMASGCVPIAFRSFLAVEDIVDQGINGVLVPAFDLNAYARALRELMMSDDLRQRMCMATRHKADQFSMANIGPRWLQMLEAVTAGGSVS